MEFDMQPYAYQNYTLRAEDAPTTVRRYEPTNHAAVAIAGVGFVIVVFTFLPAGIVTAPLALCGVRAYERGVTQGRFDPSDKGHFAIARILAWVSFALSLPWVLAGLVIFCLMFAR
jgi:hypothetical protein